MRDVEVFPDVQIGVTEEGEPYYAKDLAKVLFECTGWRQWGLMDSVAKEWMRLFENGTFTREDGGKEE